MKKQSDFGDPYDDENPFDWDFNSYNQDDTVLFPDDTEVAYALIHKARAEVIFIGTDRDGLIELAKMLGVWRESGIYSAPFNVNAGDLVFPHAP